MRQKTTRYPTTLRTFAHRLYTEKGYSVPQVYEAVVRRGYNPSPATVNRWCRPEVRDAHNAFRRIEPYQFKRRRKSAWWAKYRRMRQLRDLGLSYAAIAKLMNFDYDLNLTAEYARFLLKNDGATATKHLEP